MLGMSCGIITKASVGNLEVFVRVRMQDDLLKTCKSPEKGRKNKIEDGIFCSKTKGKFLIKLSKDLACEEPI